MGPHDPRSCGWVVGNDGFRWQGVRCWLISWSVTCVDIVYRARSTGPQPRRGHVPYLLVSLPAHGGWPWPGLVAKQRPPKGRLGAPCPWRRLSSWRRVSCYRAISRVLCFDACSATLGRTTVAGHLAGGSVVRCGTRWDSALLLVRVSTSRIIGFGHTCIRGWVPDARRFPSLPISASHVSALPLGCPSDSLGSGLNQL